MAQHRFPRIEIGDQLFSHDGGEEFGAVRDVQPDGRPELIVYIENSGEYSVPLSAVTAVHSGKVVLDLNQLPESVKTAVSHAHEREDY
ncbi:MAG TPA: hypothetical protein VJR89_02345 [Polyangiales bacterium]|nr:hypothetical protein [Polyangiales bacterium]